MKTHHNHSNHMRHKHSDHTSMIKDYKPKVCYIGVAYLTSSDFITNDSETGLDLVLVSRTTTIC